MCDLINNIAPLFVFFVNVDSDAHARDEVGVGEVVESDFDGDDLGDFLKVASAVVLREKGER